MKKNKMMRIASVLLIAAMLSTCVISGTFAKYVTSGNSTDSARVAKWGVEVVGAADMFKTSYAKDDNSFTLSSYSVVSGDSDKVLAPGTNGTLTDVALLGTPEVAVRVTYEATVDLSNWNIDGVEYYCPIVITVEGTDYYGMSYANEAAFEAAVKTAIEGCAMDYSANQNLAESGVGAKAPSVSWAWAFEQGNAVGATPTVCSLNNDVNDTALGDKAADGNAVKIEITITTTVTQID